MYGRFIAKKEGAVFVACPVYFSNSNAKPKTDGLFPIPDPYFVSCQFISYLSNNLVFYSVA